MLQPVLAALILHFFMFAGIICIVMEAARQPQLQAYLEQGARKVGQSDNGCRSHSSLSGDPCCWCWLALVPCLCSSDWIHPWHSILHGPLEVQEGTGSNGAVFV